MSYNNSLKHKSGGKIKNFSYSMKNALVNYYLLIMFTAFPLFFTNEYFNIRHDKYGFFLATSLVAIISVLSVIAMSVYDTNSSDDRLFKLKNFSFTDYSAIAFLVVSIISTLLSDYKLDSLAGTAGRNNGLILTAVYIGVYFMITRLYVFKEYVITAFAVGASVVFLLAVLNCFYWDPLGMYIGLSDKQTIANFTSTIGNKNLMSSFICIALPVFIAMSVVAKNNVLKIIYYIACGLGFASLMTADSDSGIVGVGFVLVVFFIWFSRNISRLKRFFFSLAVMLLSAKLLRLFSFFMNDYSKGMDRFQKFFVYNNFSYIILAVVVILTVVLYLFNHKYSEVFLPKAVPVTLSVFFALALITIIAISVYYSFINTSASLGSFDTLLRFNDKWGTHRGFMWIRAFWIFGDLPFVQKLFGTGPDTFYYAFEPYFGELMKFGDSSTNAAHNEYINYLITLGVFGLTSYLIFIGSAIANAVKASAKNPVAIAFACSCICYAVQAVVNIAQPITTPLFIIFISLSQAVAVNYSKR